MAAPLLFLSLAGTGISAYAQYRSSIAQAEAAKTQSLLDLNRAEEVRRRARVRSDIFEQEGVEFQAKQATTLVEKGIDPSSGTALLLLEDTANRIKEQLIMSEKEAAFDEYAARLNAQQLFEEARDMEINGIISALGTLTFGGAQAARAGGLRG